MARTIHLRVPADAGGTLAAELDLIDGVVGLSLQPGGSLKPPGDLLTVDASNDAMLAIFRLLDQHGLGEEQGSVLTSEPRSLLTASSAGAIEAETNEMVWPEMAYQLRQETNINVNFLLTMLFAGAIAAAGLWSDTFQPVIGAMVIAAGFEPIIRMPFGLMGHSGRSARLGLASTVTGYGTLALGAALAVLILGQITPSSTLLADHRWIRYWSSFQDNSILLALSAGAAGAVIISSGRSVLTAGVMITLALIPAMSIAGMAIAAGELDLAYRAVVRWLVEAACVAGAGATVFSIKRWVQHRGPS